MERWYRNRRNWRRPRIRIPGGIYFFTVNLLERYPNDLLVRHISALRDAARRVRRHYPFHIDAWVVLPDHLHTVWKLPPSDDDYHNRWRTIKQHFSGAQELEIEGVVGERK
jgi:putative transposase